MHIAEQSIQGGKDLPAEQNTQGNRGPSIRRSQFLMESCNMHMIDMLAYTKQKCSKFTTVSSQDAIAEGRARCLASSPKTKAFMRNSQRPKVW